MQVKELRTVLLCVRWAIASALVVVAVKLTVSAMHIPIEAGGILFAPMLLGMAALCFVGAMAVVVPWWRHRGDGGGFWAAVASIFSPF